MKIKIDGQEFEVDHIFTGGCLSLLEIGGREYYVAESSESAGEASRKYWEDLAQDDPKEFACLVGEETLVQWGLERYAGPGSTKVRSLQEWLDLHLDVPEENFASYDGSECEATDADEELIEELGFEPTVAYRHN
jgi:hypothetical protein